MNFYSSGWASVARPPYFCGIAIPQSNPSKPSQGLLIALPSPLFRIGKKVGGAPKMASKQSEGV